MKNEITVVDIAQHLWGKRLYTAGISILVALVVAITLLFLPNKYTSSASIVAAQEQDLGGLAGLASSFGGVASLAGINLGEGQGNAEREYMLNSRDFLFPLVKGNELLPIIIASDGINPETGEVYYDSDIYQNGQWDLEGDFLNREKNGPSDWFLAKKLNDLLSISKDDATGIIRISVEHHSPSFAANFNGLVISEINEFLRKRELVRVNTRLEYLEGQLSKSPNANVKASIYSLIEQQLQKKMLAETTKEFAFRVIEKPNYPDIKSSPLRVVLTIVSLIATALILNFFFIFAFTLKKAKEGSDY